MQFFDRNSLLNSFKSLLRQINEHFEIYHVTIYDINTKVCILIVLEAALKIECKVYRKTISRVIFGDSIE